MGTIYHYCLIKTKLKTTSKNQKANNNKLRLKTTNRTDFHVVFNKFGKKSFHILVSMNL